MTTTDKKTRSNSLPKSYRIVRETMASGRSYFHVERREGWLDSWSKVRFSDRGTVDDARRVAWGDFDTLQDCRTVKREVIR